MRLAAGILALALSAAAGAAPLTVRTGESWIFTVKDGQPAGARRAAPTARPAKGQLMVSVRALAGTTLMVTNNSPVAYVFRAELLRGGKASAARSCTLPAGARPIFEQWPQTAEAVRIGEFRVAGPDGRC